MPSTTYFIRFNEPGNIEAIIEKLKEYERTTIVKEYKNYEELSGIHYHVKVTAHIKDQMLRKIFNSLGFRGNKSLSLKEWVPSSGGERYLFKGRSKDDVPDVIFTNEYSDEEITTYHNDYWIQNESSDSRDGSSKRKVVTFQQKVIQKGAELKMTADDYLNRQLIAAHVVDSYTWMQDRGFKRRQMQESYEQLLAMHNIDNGSGKVMREFMIETLMINACDRK